MRLRKQKDSFPIRASKACACLFSGLLLLSLSVVELKAQAYQWKNVQIQGGGLVSGVIYNQTQKDLVYCRTDVGGAYRWDAPNKTWIPISDAFPNGDDYGVISLATDPTDPTRVYMATGLYTQSWAGTGNIMSSTDKGATWTRNSLTIKLGGNESGRTTGERLQVDPNLGSTLFLGSSTDGLWKSTNYGSTWSKVSSFPVATSPIGSGGISFVLFDKSSGTAGTATPTIYVGVLQTGTNFYKSTDGGATWQAVAGQPAFMPHQAALASNGLLYMAYSDGPGPNGITAGGVYKYNTASGAWTTINPPSGQGGYGGVSVDAQNPNHLVVSTMNRWSPGDEVFRSTDGGSTWKATLGDYKTWDYSLAPYGKDSNPHWTGDVDIDPFNAENAWFITGYGLFNTNTLSASTVKWIFQNNGLEETVPIEITSPPSGAPLLSALGDIDGYKHDNLDVSPPAGRFTPRYGTNSSIDFAEKLPSLIVRTHNNTAGKFGSYSIDGGIKWTAFGAAPTGTKYGGGIAVAADGTRLVWAPEEAGGIYYSTNKGTSWTKSTGISASLKPIADRVNPMKFYAYDGEGGRVYVSTDGGASFTAKATLPTVFSWETWQTTIRTVFGIEGDIWLTNVKGLYHSTDAGTSFTQISGIQNSTKVGFGKAMAGKTYPSVYIVGRVNNVYGIHRSDDAGTTWTRINDDLHQFGSINTITGDQRVRGRLYIGTGGRGIVYGQSADLLDADCNGVKGGSAYVDNCAKCVGGNTGQTACVVTGIEDEKNPTFQYSPNPFTGALHLQSLYPFNYAITTLVGTKVASGSGRGDSFIGAELQPGAYIMTIETNGITRQVKIIKQ